MTMPPNTSELAPSLSQLKVVIGGIQKLSLVDYPGHVAAALFLSGCNMRCGSCHAWGPARPAWFRCRGSPSRTSPCP